MKSSGARGSERAQRPFARLIAARRPLVLDGAMGTELERRGVSTALPLWSALALESSPETVRQIHKDSIDAGADIITGDTFRTTRRTFQRAGLPDRSGELTALAVSLAADARASRPGRAVLIAGSMAPLEDCYRPDIVPPDADLRSEHAEHAQRLAEAGVDILLIETVGTIREAVAAAESAAATGLEFIVSFLCTPEGTLYSGEPLGDAVRLVAGLRPSALSINCVSPRVIAQPLAELKRTLWSFPGGKDIPFGLYANVGAPGGEQGTVLHEDVGPRAYGALAREWVSAGASFVGGCCGTTPEHIRAVAAAFKKEG